MPFSVVLGGTAGIGLATARQLGDRGDTVTVVGRDPDRLAAALQSCPGLNGVGGDAADPAVLDRAVAGRTVDHLVLALTGRGGGGPLAELDLGILRSAFEAKFWTQLTALQHLLPSLAPAGSVTFLTAVSAHIANPATAGLAAVNGALEAMVGPLARELAPVRVNAVSPGVVDTEWWSGLGADRESFLRSTAEGLPVGRVGHPDDIAAAVVAVAVNPYVTGTVLSVDGGMHLTA